MNTDQGSQFTSSAWTGRLRRSNVRISMNGKARRDPQFMQAFHQRQEMVVMASHKVIIDQLPGQHLGEPLGPTHIALDIGIRWGHQIHAQVGCRF